MNSKKVKRLKELKEENHTWSMDFVTDVLENKRRFKMFNIMDNYNREALFLEIDFSLNDTVFLQIFKL